MGKSRRLGGNRRPKYIWNLVYAQPVTRIISTEQSKQIAGTSVKLLYGESESMGIHRSPRQVKTSCRLRSSMAQSKRAMAPKRAPEGTAVDSDSLQGRAQLNKGCDQLRLAAGHRTLTSAQELDAFVRRFVCRRQSVDEQIDVVFPGEPSRRSLQYLAMPD